MSSGILGTSDKSGCSTLVQCSGQYYQPNICVVLLVGIPASGKSYFRTFLENYCEANSSTVLGTLQVFSVSYDKVSKLRNPTNFSDAVVWKEERVKIIKAVENTIRSLKDFARTVCGFPLNSLCIINPEINNPNTVLFVIDDNMYYQSMRYEYYKLSRSYNISFCQLFFNVTLQDALKHNSQREPWSQVPEYVIKKMFDVLETPDKTVLWEKNTLEIPPYINFEKDNILNEILSVIDTVLKCPVQPNLDSLRREEAQHITNSNATHQIDILLKQLVGNFIKQRLKESSENPHKISQYFSEKRLGLLNTIKEGKIVLPVDLSKPISKQDIQKIAPILADFLHSSVSE